MEKILIIFIDFERACDRFPKDSLFQELQRLGSGSTTLCALVAMHCVTESWVGSALLLIVMEI